MNHFSITGLVSWLLFPAACPSCGEIPDMDKSGFCPRCEKTLSRIKEPFCLKCGCPLSDDEAQYCSVCKQNFHSFIQNLSAFTYSGSAKTAMYGLKYKGRRWIGRILAKEIFDICGEQISLVRPQAIVPVPMNRKKARERGYNQAEILAVELSKEIKNRTGAALPVLDLLERTQNTAAQKKLSASLRRKNLKKAFKINKNSVILKGMYFNGEMPLFRRVLLVDDIYTTGATMDACAGLLLDFGIAGEVFGLTALSGQSLDIEG